MRPRCHLKRTAEVARPDRQQMTDALLTVAAFIRGGLDERHDATARLLAVTGADETRRVASAALDLATVLLCSHAEGLGLDPHAYLDELVRALVEQR
jgi:hypothetical protein